MSTNTDYPHLVIDGDGQASVGKTRYRVLHLAAEHYQHGWTAEELLRQHPDLRPEEVYSALTFFYDHHEQMVTEMKQSLTVAEANRHAEPLSRGELVRRKAAQGK
jgi:uncharacterized protein (DUF433 family)